MKFLVYFVSIYCLVQSSQAQSPTTDGLDRSTVQTILNVVASGLTTVNDFAQHVDQKYFPDPVQNRNNTVDLYVKIATTVFDLVANFTEDVVNVTGVGAQELVSCVHAQKDQARQNIANNIEFLGTCITKQVPNLSIGFKDQLAGLNATTSTVVAARTNLQSCRKGDILCLIDLASSLTKGVTGAVKIFKQGTQEVLAAYKIMFGTDVPACNEETKPLFAKDISNLLDNVVQCLKL